MCDGPNHDIVLCDPALKCGAVGVDLNPYAALWVLPQAQETNPYGLTANLHAALTH